MKLTLRYSISMLLIGFCSCTFAADTAPQMLQTLLSKFRSLQAHFVETMVIQGNSQQSSGEVAIQRPNRFRWTTTTPSEQLYVSDGKQLWQYEADLDQVTVQPINNQAALYSPLMLLSGQVSDLSRLYTITVLGDEQFQLVPNSSDSLINSMTLTFSHGVLSELDLTNTMGQVTTIVFSKVQMNQPIDSKLFQFVPPASADVLRG